MTPANITKEYSVLERRARPVPTLSPGGDESAVELEEYDFRLFHTMDPARQPDETFEEYKFRQKVLRRSTKRYLKGNLQKN